MQELIDKHAAYNALKHEAETHELSFLAEAYDRAARIIDQMHTIEPEVRHGRWVDTGINKYICTVCKGYVYKYCGKSDFCPNCGADMREGGADNG